MFKWLDLACKKEPRFECIAWLKFTGVPLITWDEYNFSVIAMQYEKILTQANTFASCSDIYYGKVGIITSHRKKINEEIIGMLNWKLYLNYISEIDDDWYPFKPLSPMRQEEPVEEGIKTRKMTS